MRRIIHISDLHFGRIRPETVDRLLAHINELNPDVVAISGDLTQRARASQFLEARSFLDRLRFPYVVVPGNHDVPLFNLYGRFFEPFKNYCKYISENLTPCFYDGEILVQGLTTARSRTISGGKLRDQHVQEAIARIRDAAPGIVKLIVTHHPLALFGVLDGVHAPYFRDVPVDIYLCGHLHQSQVQVTSKLTDELHHSALLIQSGTSTSSRLRHESNAFNMIEVELPQIRVRHYLYQDDTSAFSSTGFQIFQLSKSGWAEAASRTSG